MGAQDLNGAGSSFAYPLYSRWSADYQAKTGVKVNYQSVGSGAGVKQFQEMTVDFGGTDAPMTDAELAAAKGGAVLHVPTGMGAVVSDGGTDTGSGLSHGVPFPRLDPNSRLGPG